MPAYYNEYEPYAAEWLRNLIKKGLIPDGEVDTRSIVDVAPDDLRAFTQCHFFAGIGGWGHALRLAGWPDDRPIWTGSAPCQPFSVAGKGAAQADERHLWPVFFDLIRACRPPVVMGEQVAAAVGKSWLDGVSADLEGIGYATGAAVVPACAVDAPHRRDRLWFVANSTSARFSLSHGTGASATRQPDAKPECGGGLHCDVADARYDESQGWIAGQDTSAGASAGNSTWNEPASCRISHGDSHMADADDHGRQAGRGDDQAARYGDPVAAEGGSDVGNVGDAALHEPERDAWARARSGQAEGWRPSSELDRPGDGISGGGNVGDAPGAGRQQHGGAFAVEQELEAAERGGGGAWANTIWLTGADGKARRVEPSICLLAHGVPGRVGRLRAYGNAIVPQVAAEVIMAFMEATEAA
jgi:DNA (cytosine-5)-methyltransferase 1